MSSSSPKKASATVPPQIPERKFTKRRRASLEISRILLAHDLEVAKNKIKPTHSLDATYWTSAANATHITYQLRDVEMHIAIHDWNEKDAATDWWKTTKARRWVAILSSLQYERDSYRKQAEQVKKVGTTARAMTAMFTTSQVGLGITEAGGGKRSRSEQSKFKNDLIEAYDAAFTNPRKPTSIQFLHDVATGKKQRKDIIRAAHIVPHSLGRDMQAALFGESVEGELDTPYNGILVDRYVEKAMDDGAIAIVPDLCDNPPTKEVAEWKSREPKEYKWQVIDGDAESLDQALLELDDPEGEVFTVRELHGRRLSFRNDKRPRARYLYFLFIVAQLRLAWRHAYHPDPSEVLGKRLGKGFWATKGHYLKRSFLRAVAEEIGHDDNAAVNTPPAPDDGGDSDDDNDLDPTGIIGIGRLWWSPQGVKTNEDTSDSEDTSDDEDE
ncbi:hypothetical protein Hte_012194 [Hypoxylon texense]